MLAATVQGSRAERLKRQQARIRDRGGIYKPESGTPADNPLLAKLLSRLEQTPAPSEHSTKTTTHAPKAASPVKRKVLTAKTRQTTGAAATAFKSKIRKPQFVRNVEEVTNTPPAKNKGKGKANTFQVPAVSTVIAEELVPLHSPSRKATTVRRRRKSAAGDDSHLALSTVSTYERSPPKPKRTRSTPRNAQAGPSIIPLNQLSKPLDGSSRPTRTRSRVRLAVEVESLSSGGTRRSNRTFFGSKLAPEPIEEPPAEEQRDAEMEVSEAESSLSAVGRRKAKKKKAIVEEVFLDETEDVVMEDVDEEPELPVEEPKPKGGRKPKAIKAHVEEVVEEPANPAIVKRRGRRKAAPRLVEEEPIPDPTPPSPKKKGVRKRKAAPTEVDPPVEETPGPTAKRRRTKQPAASTEDANLVEEMPPQKRGPGKRKEGVHSRKIATKFGSKSKARTPPASNLALANETLMADSDFDPLDIL